MVVDIKYVSPEQVCDSGPNEFINDCWMTAGYQGSVMYLKI